MKGTVISATLKLTLWGLAALALAGLVLGGLIASPVRRPPELTSISKTARAVDRSGMPVIERFHARDGTELGYRRYPAGPPAGQIAVLVHGSSGSSTAVHALAKALAARGVETYAPDIRGHGASGTRGDIGYLGQLEDDVSDMVGEIRKTSPGAQLVLIGFSAGGGFALRVAGSPTQKLFERTVLLAPYLGYDAASTRGADAGGWASPDIPRFIGLTVLRRLGILCCESLPTIAFAVAPNTSANLASTYSYRLMRNFGPTQAYRDDLAAAAKPVAVFAGSADELMFADKYKDAVGERVPVKLIDGVNHMGLVSDPAAVSAIADYVSKAGSGS
jgi:alpha-beta hydrolase superfamily lysophospholipase